MIDIKELKNLILEDHENIRIILEYIGCDRIVFRSKEYRCAKNHEDTNNTRVVVKINNNLTSRIYDLIPIKGDIFVIIMELKQCNLSTAIKICCNALGINSYDIKINETKKRKAFGGFYRKIQSKFNDNNNLKINEYEDEILNNYINKGNLRFFYDGINYETQTKFNIMYDYENNRIAVPWRHHYSGKIIGIMGRYNESAEYCTKNNIGKWMPFKNLEFPKSQILYGLYQNYKNILQLEKVYVGESEKFVLQLHSLGIKNAVAIGSHEISPKQRELLLSLNADIVTCMDNDIPKEFNLIQCKKLLPSSNLLNRKIGFMETKNILKGKESPSDRGLDIWNKCIKNICWIN